jgi:hypothetical protein
MRRTIVVKGLDAHYRGKKLDYIALQIRNHFNLRGSKRYKYSIDVTASETGEYQLCGCCATDDDGNRLYFELERDGIFRGRVCIKHITKLFPFAEVGGRYDITVKKVKK